MTTSILRKKTITFTCELSNTVLSWQKEADTELSNGNYNCAIRLLTKAYENAPDSLYSYFILSNAYRLADTKPVKDGEPIENGKHIALNILRRLILMGEAKLHLEADWSSASFTDDSIENLSFAKAMLYLVAVEIFDVRNTYVLNLLGNVLIGFKHIRLSPDVSQVLYHVSKSGNLFRVFTDLLESRKADEELISYVKGGHFVEYLDFENVDPWVVSYTPFTCRENNGRV